MLYFYNMYDKNPNTKRTESILFRTTLKEKQSIQISAILQNCSVSDLIRKTMLNNDK